MSLLERLDEQGLGVTSSKEGLIEARPHDVDRVRSLVRACREAESSVLFEVDGLPPSPLWAPAREPAADASGGKAVVVRVSLEGICDLEVDGENLLATVGAGVKVDALEEQLVSRGYTLGFQDPPAEPVGAWLAGSEPGPCCRRSFPGWSPVAALEAVLLEGTIVRTSLTPRSATGPDPKALLVGGAGRLGVITRATLRIHPCARAKRIVMAFVDPGDALGAVVEALGRGLVPDSFGLLDGGVGETLLTWETNGEPGRVARGSLLIDEVAALNGGRRLGSLVRDPGSSPSLAKEASAATPSHLGAAGASEVRAAACRFASKGAEARVAVGFGARWSRVLLVRRALLNSLGPGVRLHLERALPEGCLGIACVEADRAEEARAAIRKAGAFPAGDEDRDSWIEGVCCALLGDGR